MSDSLVAASAYLERGWRLVPVPRGSKKPILDSWPTLRLEADELASHFTNGENIGVLNGEPSGWLADVDLDCPEAVLIGPDLLPETVCIFGRPGKPRSHFQYIAFGTETRQYRDTDGTMLLELRSTGTMTLWPPSVAGGEQRAWFRDGDPAHVAAAVLAARVGCLAAAVLLARHWPARGARHDASLALAGGLARAGWSDEETASFVQAVCTAASDEEARARVGNVATTARRVAQNGEATGWPSLAELVGEPVVKKVREWLGVSSVSSVSQPHAGIGDEPLSDGWTGRPIRVNDRFLRAITRDALAALEAANEPEPTLFRRGDVLVHVARQSSALEVRPLRHAGLKGLLDRAADFVKVKETKQGPVPVPARPPDDVVADILSLPNTPLPLLCEIAAAPLVLLDGRVLRASGYDASSGFLLDLRGMEDVRDDLSRDEAAHLLADELLVDFPFADEASLAHAVGMLVQPFARPLIVGPTPMFLIEAPGPGNGKGLLAELAGELVDGRDPAVMGLSGNEEEIEKRVTALLIQASRLILLDNVNEIRSPTIAAVLTATTHRGRVLGRSQMVSIPNTALWIATGNNVELSKEMGRRVIPIRLDAGVEHPEDRTEFEHDLPTWALQHRVELVSACLSLVTRWQDAGRPAGPSSLGRYESWAAVIGGIVTHAGFGGFLSNRGDRVAAADRESAEWAALCTAWWGRWHETPIAAGAVLDLASEHGVLLDLYAGRTRLSGLQRIGRALASRRDAVVGRWVIRPAGQDSRTHHPCYRLEQQSGGQCSRDNVRNATNATDQVGQHRASRGGQGRVTLQTPQNVRETPGSREGNDQIADEPDPEVCSVSHVSERPHLDPRELVAADVGFAAHAAGLALDPAEVAGRLLADHPELAGLGNVERLGAVTAILRRKDG